MIERFRWWHIAEVLPIEEDLFGAEKWSAAMFWNELAQRHHYLVALDGQDVLGYAGLAVTDPDESWVQNIAVRRDAQQKGLGRALLEALLAEAARRGVRKTLLEVAVDNQPAQKLYVTYDFEPVGIRRGYYQPSNTDALVMMRSA
jgi:ribosomal-protein-alanine N-acetyltransferase